MCLYANTKQPLKGRCKPKFDKDGYAKCWKVYSGQWHGGYCRNQFVTVYKYATKTVVRPGTIKSNRAVQAAGKDEKDCTCLWWENTTEINRGIHVYGSRQSAARSIGNHGGCYIVPVRCHKKDLIAISRDMSQYTFMKVSLDKKDHDRAISERAVK